MPDKLFSIPSLIGTDLPPDSSLSERVYVGLRERIVTLELPPGALVDEPALMRELGISRTPVREAILRLALEKLVSVIPRRGTFVSEVHVGDVGKVYEFRCELEKLTAGWAAERRSDSDMPEIEAMIGELRRSEAQPDARAMIATDQRAHQLTYRLARNPYLAETMTLYYFLGLRIWFLSDSRGAGLGGPHHSLAAVLEAIRDQDPVAARTAAEQHNQLAETAVRSGF